jgi:hypothetical protein
LNNKKKKKTKKKMKRLYDWISPYTSYDWSIKPPTPKLPIEIWQSIFAHTDIKTLCTKAVYVQKEWATRLPTPTLIMLLWNKFISEIKGCVLLKQQAHFNITPLWEPCSSSN